MEWLIVQVAIPAAMPYGVVGVAAAVVFGVAAVPACLLVRHALYGREPQPIAVRHDDTMRHAA